MDKAGAEASLLKELDGRVQSARGGIAIVKEATIDLDYGWAFFYRLATPLGNGRLELCLGRPRCRNR
jgi:hypothetical protein